MPDLIRHPEKIKNEWEIKMMNTAIKTTTLAILLPSLLFCGGCIAFYSHEKYHIKVIDAERNKPVENAVVSTRYIYMMILNGPKPREAITNQDGLAELKITNAFPCDLTIKANGYVLNRGRGYHRKWYIPENSIARECDEILVPIYKEPEPKVEIIVPNGYRGPVALHLIPTEKWIQEEAEKRMFSYTMLPNGYVPVQASPLLCDFNTFSLSVRYENGDILSSGKCGPDDICLRWVWARSFKGERLYVVGTEKDRQFLDVKVKPEKVDKDGSVYSSIDDEIYNSYFQESRK